LKVFYRKRREKNLSGISLLFGGRLDPHSGIVEERRAIVKIDLAGRRSTPSHSGERESKRLGGAFTQPKKKKPKNKKKHKTEKKKTKKKQKKTVDNSLLGNSGEKRRKARGGVGRGGREEVNRNDRERGEGQEKEEA